MTRAMAQRRTGVCPKACCGECLTVEEVQQVLAALDSGDDAGLEAAASLLLGEEGHKGPAALTLQQPWVPFLPFVPPSLSDANSVAERAAGIVRVD